MNRQSGKWIAALALAALLATPFLVVDFPPLTDLPQHMNQGRLLLGEAWQDGSPYTVDLFTPYLMTYLFIMAALSVLHPIQAITAAMIGLSTAWTAAVLLGRHGRIVYSAGALLALGFFYNQSLYWGLIHHVFGACFFVAFAGLLQRTEQRRHLVWVAIYGVLIFFVHIYWVVFSSVFLAARFILRPTVRWHSFVAGIAMIPGCLVVLLWIFVTPQEAVPEYGWLLSPWERMAPGPFVRAALGGIKHDFEQAYVFFSLAYCAAIAAAGYYYKRRADQGQHNAATGATGGSEIADESPENAQSDAWDRDLLLAAGLALLWGMLLPEGNERSTLIAVRWFPYACAFLLLATPRFPFRGRKLNRGLLAFSALLLAGLVGLTADRWRKFEREEYAGFAEAIGVIEALPTAPSIVGLSYYPNSRYIHGFPFVHHVAYGQLVRGGRVNNSFTDYPLCPVVYRKLPHAWTPRLEMRPQYFHAGDLQYFTHVLLAGPDELHARLAGEFDLAPVTHDGRWRLYRTPHAER